MCKIRLQGKYRQLIFYHYVEKNFENNAISLEQNEILNRIVEKIVCMIASALASIKKRQKQN